MSAPKNNRLDSAPPARPLILVVDDEEPNIRLIVRALEDQYTILTATNGLDALLLMKEQRPDLVLLDFVLPDIDGLEVLRQARADPTLVDIPIAFVTVVADSARQTAALQMSALDYRIKPFNLTHLRLRVRNQLEIKLQRDMICALNGELESRNAELQVTLDRVLEQEAIIVSMALASAPGSKKDPSTTGGTPDSSMIGLPRSRTGEYYLWLSRTR